MIVVYEPIDIPGISAEVQGIQLLENPEFCYVWAVSSSNCRLQLHKE